MTNNYIQLLEHSYRTQCNLNEDMSRLGFLGDYIFFFTTYDSEMAELFASKALEVCAIISNQTAFTYIDDAENYRWYLLMINMPFFARRLNWGTSIRGAWWNHEGQALETCGLWEGDDQTLSLTFTRSEWRDFIAAMTEFAEPDKAAIADPVKNADEPTHPSKEHIRMLADQIIADYKEHYDFPCQGESHMHDCITDDLKKFELTISNETNTQLDALMLSASNTVATWKDPHLSLVSTERAIQELEEALQKVALQKEAPCNQAI